MTTPAVAAAFQAKLGSVERLLRKTAKLGTPLTQSTLEMMRAIFVIGVGGTPIAESFVPIFVGGLAIGICMVLIWWCLCSWTFRRLRTRHSALYESLGSPTLFWNTSPQTQLSFASFLFGFSWRHLSDPTLVRVCWSMVVFFIVYCCYLAAALATLSFTTSWRK
jgi:hypothetical protein